jgi:quinoprotein glucose dehydrogenase
MLVPNQTDSPLNRLVRRGYAALLVLLGAALLLGGIVLIAYGGSFYYALAGAALGLSGVLIWRQDRRGILLYAAVLIATVGWAVMEVGLGGWGLVA